MPTTGFEPMQHATENLVTAAQRPGVPEPATTEGGYRYEHQPPPAPLPLSESHIEIPRSLHGCIFILRYSGPEGKAIPYPTQINLDCDKALVPASLALGLGYAFNKRRTRREIFPILDPRESLASTPGHLNPDWFVRDFGILWRSDSTTPDLQVKIHLSPIPDEYSGLVDMDQLKTAFNAPRVVISRALLISMIRGGFELPRFSSN